MHDTAFQEALEQLAALDLISIVEDVSGNRVRLKRSLRDVLSSQYTQDKLKQLYADLAAAMEMYPGDDPGFYADLARTLVKAGLTSRALPYYKQAALGYQDHRLWDMAVKIWHELSLAYAVLDRPRERANACAGVPRPLLKTEISTLPIPWATMHSKCSRKPRQMTCWCIAVLPWAIYTLTPTMPKQPHGTRKDWIPPASPRQTMDTC